MNDNDPSFAQDLLMGADAIAEFLYGDKGFRRKVYHIIATSRFPHFKLGSVICARRSIVLAWIESQELRHANDNIKPETKFVKTGNG